MVRRYLIADAFSLFVFWFNSTAMITHFSHHTSVFRKNKAQSQYL